MDSGGLLAVDKPAIDVELENAPAGGDQLEGRDVVAVLLEYGLSDAEGSWQIPSAGAVFQTYLHPYHPP